MMQVPHSPTESQDENSVTKQGLSVCIDAGGTKCAVAIADHRGTIAQAEGGSCNVTDVGIADMLDIVTSTTQKALAQLPPTSGFQGLTFPLERGPAGAESPFVVVLAGVAGFDRSTAAQRAVEDALSGLYCVPTGSRLRITNDVDLLAFAVKKHIDIKTWIVLIAGTGSVAMSYRVTATSALPVRIGRSGGWGYVLGDDGSGFDMGRQGVRAVLAALERGRLAAGSHKQLVKDVLTPFQLAIIRSLGVPAESNVDFDFLSEVLQSGSHGSSTLKSRIAGVAPVILDAAASDSEAHEMVSSAVDSLVRTLTPLIRPGGLDPQVSALVLTGGLMRNQNYRDRLLQKLETTSIRFKAVEIVTDVAKAGVESLLL